QGLLNKHNVMTMRLNRHIENLIGRVDY
ncbi:hypothetical protein MGSAQ_003182, partial [marine sediment metagenome]